MSKQLYFSATLAVLCMAVFAVTATFGGLGDAPATHMAGRVPLIEGFVGR